MLKEWGSIKLSEKWRKERRTSKDANAGKTADSVALCYFEIN